MESNRYSYFIYHTGVAIEVFVVEQDCVYQDIDGKDAKANHLLGYENDQLIAYSRLFKPGDYFEEYSFGRAVIKQTHRGLGLGDELVQQSIQALGLDKEIKISAQYHLENYIKNIFVSQGDTYLEDDISYCYVSEFFQFISKWVKAA